METRRYILAALACGLIAVFASENLFWSAPPADWTPTGMALTWIAYVGAAGVALSAVAWTGCGGWRGLFLGGALMGFTVEGVIVDTMYDVFPFQLVWTPLAWHALISALAVGGIGRARWPLARVALAYAGVGAGLGAFGLYWPVERGDMGGMPLLALAGYLAGLGLALPVGNIVLDRLGSVPRPGRGVLLALPAVALAIWTAKTAAFPVPARLAGPAMLLATLWAMRRLGSGEAVTFGNPVVPARHALALFVPLAALAVLIPGYRLLPGGAATNVIAALTTAPVGLGLWLWCLVRAAQRPAAGPPAVGA